MKHIKHALKEIFDFFCGDWRIFFGVAVTILVIEVIDHQGFLAFAAPFAGILFILGISLSLVISLKHEITK